jgi:death-on-curing protein
MTEPRWISLRGLRLLQEESLAEHGGIAGIRDQGLLESALARPQNLFAYEGVTDVARLAASYAFGIAKNHPFADGNKRAAFAAAGLFLAKNRFDLTASQTDAYGFMIGLASSEIGEEEFSAWLRDNIKPR